MTIVFALTLTCAMLFAARVCIAQFLAYKRRADGGDIAGLRR